MKLTTLNRIGDETNCLATLRMAMEARSRDAFEGFTLDCPRGDGSDFYNYNRYNWFPEQVDRFSSQLFDLSLKMRVKRVEMMDWLSSWRVSLVMEDGGAETTNIGAQLVEYLCGWIDGGM